MREAPWTKVARFSIRAHRRHGRASGGWRTFLAAQAMPPRRTAAAAATGPTLNGPSSPAALAQVQPAAQPPSCLEPPAPPAHAGRRTARRGAPLAWLRGDAHWERVDAHGMI